MIKAMVVGIFVLLVCLTWSGGGDALGTVKMPFGYNSVFSYNTNGCRLTDQRRMKLLAWKPPLGQDESTKKNNNYSVAEVVAPPPKRYNCSCGTIDCCDERTFCDTVKVQREDFTPYSPMKPDPYTRNYTVFITLNGTWQFDDFYGGIRGLVVVSNDWYSYGCLRYGGIDIYHFSFNDGYSPHSFEVVLDRPYKYVRACFESDFTRDVNVVWKPDSEFSVFYRS